MHTVEDVVRLTRDFIATLTPEDLMLLPESCRPLRVKAEDDIEYWAYKLSAIPPSERGEHEQCACDVEAGRRVAAT